MPLAQMKFNNPAFNVKYLCDLLPVTIISNSVMVYILSHCYFVVKRILHYPSPPSVVNILNFRKEDIPGYLWNVMVNFGMVTLLTLKNVSTQ